MDHRSGLGLCRRRVEKVRDRGYDEAREDGAVSGPHTFRVQAVDAAGRVIDPMPASRTWTVDTTAPTVGAVTPADGTTVVSRGTTVTATFSEAVNASTLDAPRVTLVSAGGTRVTATVSYDAASRKVTLRPPSRLAALTKYTATVKGGPGGAADQAGNALAADKTWSFTTR